MTDFGDVLPTLLTEIPGPRSKAWIDRLRAVESSNVTYRSEGMPVFWDEARGTNVRDGDGNTFLDLTGAFGVSLAGHGHPRIVRAIREQAGRLMHGMGDVHPPRSKLDFLERLRPVLPWENVRAVLGTSGSEAVEIGLKTALLCTGRPGVIAFRGGYHGLSFGALAETARGQFRSPFADRLYRGVGHATFPTRESEVARSLDEVAQLLRMSEAPVGAVLVEPIQGRAGVRIPPSGFLAGLAELTREAGALLVFDEIFTGMGRTGADFAFQHDGVVPDILCLGKALGGGMPISVCAAPERLMSAWPESEGEALHTSTFLGHPIACAAATAFLDVFESERLTERARERGRRMIEFLGDAFDRNTVVNEVRGRGLMIGVEFDSSATPHPGAVVAERALRQGLIVLPAGDDGEVIELTPAVSLTDAQMEYTVEVLEEIVRTL